MAGRFGGAAVILMAIVASCLAEKPTPEQIQQAVRDLGDRRFAVRERASRLLWEAGADAELSLRQLLPRGDAEAVRRARILLDKFEWGIFPDTPPAILSQIDAFRGGDREARLQATARLMDLGRAGYATLRRLVDRESDSSVRTELYKLIAQNSRRALSELLAVGDEKGIGELLERCLLAGSEEADANYVAWTAFTGQLPLAIPRWEAAWKRERTPTNGRVLVLLLRAAGEFNRARLIAKDVDAALLEAVLWEEGNWAELSARFRANPEDTRDTTRLRQRAFAHRLADQPGAFEGEVTRLRRLANEPTLEVLKGVARSLCLIGRSDDALELLRRNPIAPSLLFDLLFVRRQYKEAFAVAPAEDREEQFQFELRRARGHWILGQQQAATEGFDRLARSLKEDDQRRAARDLVQVLVDLRLTDRATSDVARYLNLLLKQDIREGLVEPLQPLFGDDAGVALTVWLMRRREEPGEDPSAVLRDVRRLLAGEALPTRDAWCARLLGPPDPAAPQTGPNESHQLPPALAAGVVLMRTGQVDRARVAFEQAIKETISAEVPRQIGELFLARGLARDAAEWFDRAGKLDPADALVVYLRGVARERTGDPTAAAVLRRQAHGMLLGDEDGRMALSRELTRRGFHDDAGREREFVRRSGWFRSAAASAAYEAAAIEAEHVGDVRRAADQWNRALAGHLRTGAVFADDRANLIVPQHPARLLALAKLQAGENDAALAVARAALTVIPGDLSLITALVAALDQADHPEDADRLYAEARQLYDGLCRDYPGSAFAHNARAWLALRCRRDLPLARDHAESAVKIAPAVAGYLDTLAEACFQNGDSARAIELARRCVAMEPARRYFVQQLARFQRGDRQAPLPNPGHE